MAFHGLGRVKRNRILATADRSGRVGAELVTLLLQETKGVVGPGVDPMPAVQELYIELMKRRGLDDRAARNSWAAASGKSFEGTVRNALNTNLVAKGIRAESVAGLPRYPKHLKSFWGWVPRPASSPSWWQPCRPLLWRSGSCCAGAYLTRARGSSRVSPGRFPAPYWGRSSGPPSGWEACRCRGAVAGAAPPRQAGGLVAAGEHGQLEVS